MGVLALLATSCDKNKETASFKTYNQQMEVVAGEFDGVEKVQLDPSNYNLTFESSDLLTLFRIDADPTLSASADYVPAATAVDETTWTPVGEALPAGGDLYAFCPGGSEYVTPDLANENRATFKLPAIQYYRENTCPKEGFYMASKLEEGQEHFYFRNICGILWLKIYSPNNRQVREIYVTDKAGKPLSGDVSLKIDKVNPETLTSLYRNYNPDNQAYLNSLSSYIRESGYSVTNQGGLKLYCNEPVQVGTTKATATDFFMTLRPLAMREGVDIRIVCEDGYEFTQSTTKNNIVGPNVIKKMPAFSIK